jgi:hypothetical protein
VFTLHCLWSSFFSFVRQEPGMSALALANSLSLQGWVVAFGNKFGIINFGNRLSDNNSLELIQGLGPFVLQPLAFLVLCSPS